MPKNKSKKFKILRIVIIIAILLLLSLSVSLFLIIHGYINKMHLVSDTNNSVTVAKQIIDPESESAASNKTPLGNAVMGGNSTTGVNSTSRDKNSTGNNTSGNNTSGNNNSTGDNNSLGNNAVDGNKYDELDALEDNRVEDYNEEDYNAGEESSQEAINILENKIRLNMEENSTSIKSDKAVFNVLLIGCDSREKDISGRSDAMILVSINEKAKTLTATSILRDIYLNIPGVGNNRINTAYAYGGPELLMDTIEQNFKIKIDRYAIVNFYTFIDVVNEINGITLDITQEEIPIINDYIMELNELTGKDMNTDLLTGIGGSLTLNGKQALGYVRNRSIGMDFERTARQRRALEQIYYKIKDSNLIKLNQLLNLILPQITTNLTEGELFSLILSLPSYRNYIMEQWSVPVADSYSFLRIRGMSVLGIDFEENRKEMDKRIYGTEK